MPLDKTQLMLSIDKARERSYGGDHNSEIGAKRARALESYLGANTLPAPEGRSNVVDRSVYETIHTILPSLIRIFSGSSDEVCKFLPIGPEDEAGAEQTTQVVNHVVTDLNPWEQILADWMHDALLLSNGYAMAYWDESDKSELHKYDRLSDDQLAILVADENVRIVQHSATQDEEATQAATQHWQQAAQQAALQGAQPPPQPPPQMQHAVVIERSRSGGRVCIKTIPPEHCFVSVDTPSWTLEECPYFEYRCEKTIADLRAMGLDVDDDVNDDEDAETEEDLVRDRVGETSIGEDDDLGAMRRVWARLLWVTADAEGDGKSRMYHVIAIGRTILYAEPVGRIPVASMTPQPLPHRHIGMSVAETVMDIQDIRTVITRGGLDNLNLANAGRHLISSSVSLADFLDARPGGVVRMLDDSKPADGHIVPITHPVVFDQVIGSLEYFDQVRQNRTGASRYFSGTDANAINKTASGTIALQSMASMRVEHIARMLAPAVEYLFSVVHELVSKHQAKPLTIQLRNRWVSVDPQAWMTRRDVRVSVGVGAGNRDQMMAQLQGVLGAQMQVGMPLGLVQRDNVRATNVEILKLAGFSNPEKFWPPTDALPPPQPQMPPEAIKAHAAMQQEQFRAQQDALKFQAEAQIEQQRLAMQAQVDAQREEMQARQKALESEQAAQLERLRAEYAAQQDAARLEFERWKASLDAAVKLEIASISSEATAREKSADSESRSTSDTAAMQRVERILLALNESMSAPAEVIRGADGRVAGIRKLTRVTQ